MVDERSKCIGEETKLILNLLNDPVAIVDQNGVLMLVNDAFGVATGLNPKELIGTNFMELSVLSDEAKKLVMEKWVKTMQGVPSVPYDVPFTTPTGEKRIAELKASRINFNGQPADIAIFRDVTRRNEDAKKLEEYAKSMEALVEEKIKETKESEEKFRAISASAMDAIILMDDKAEIVYWNPAATRVFGYTEEEAIGKNLEKLLLPPQQYGLHSRLPNVFLGKEWQLQGKAIKAIVLRKNGTEVPIELSASTVELKNKRYRLGIVRDISERKKLDEALRESEEKYRNLVENSKDSIVIIDFKGNVQFANSATEKLTGYAHEEGLGLNVRKITPLRYWPKSLAMLLKARKGEQIPYFESMIKKKDGSFIPVESGGQAIFKDGKIIGIQIITRDISERMRIEEELRQTEQKLRSVVYGSPIPAFFIDKDHKVVYWNGALEKYSGLKAEDIVGTDQQWKPFYPQKRPCMADLIVDEATGHIPRWYSGKFQRSELVEGAYEATDFFPAVGKNGAWLHFTAVAIRDTKGSLIGAMEVLEDVTERKKAEDNLRDSEEKLRMIIDFSPDPIVVSSMDGKVLDCNPAALQTFGYSTKSDGIGRSVFEFFVETERARAMKELASEVQSARNVEYVFQAKNGREFVGELSFCPVLQPSGKIACFVSTIRDTTERKEKEKALRESEERFKQVAENAGEWIWEVDAHGMYTYSSPVVKKILGYKPEEIVGKKHFYDLFHPENQEKLRKAALKAFEQKQPFHDFINKNVHKNGAVRWLATSGVPVLDQQGKLVGYRGADTDITEVKKAQEALQASEKNYREMINSMNDTVWVIGFDASFIDVNDAAVKVLGYSREELLSGGIQIIDKHLTKSEVQALIKRLPKVGTQVFETAHTTKDGKAVPVEICSSLVTYQGKQAILSIARDITERKKAEQALVESEAKFRTLAEQSPYMVYVNKKGRVVYANKTCEEIMGYTKKELYSPNFNFLNIIAPESREQIKSVYAQHLKNEKDVGPLEYRLITKNGKIRDALLTSRIITYEGDKAIMGMVVDVTERVKMQKKLEKYSRRLEELVEKRTQQLKRANAQLLKSERLAAIGELAGMVGHDIRNPLTGIKNAAYYLRVNRGSSLDANSKKMLGIIDSAVTRADKIVGDLQDYSREMQLGLARCSPRSILEEALALVQIPESVKIVNNALDEPLVRADRTKLVRVFMSIVKNAIDAMPDGGTLQIESIRANGNVKFSFADTGIGMSKETLRKLFSPLVTTKAQGMGFGLAICKRIVDAHGGKITVQSVEGKGSTVTVILPIEPKTKDDLSSSWIKLPKSMSRRRKALRKS